MKCNVAILAILSVIVLAVLTDRVTSVPFTQCNPSLLDAAPPRIRKVCLALLTLYEFGSAMENYNSDKVFPQSLPLTDSGVKRQDNDHVFLRFGRRR